MARFVDEITPSHYGNPEQAMLGQSIDEPDEYGEIYHSVVSELLSKLSERDRVLFHCHLQGDNQIEISARTGVSRQSVAYKIQAITGWLQRVAPYRVALAKGETIPRKWNTGVIRFYGGVVHDHAPPQLVSTASDTLLVRVVDDLLDVGTQAQVSIALFLRERPAQWTRPATRLAA